MASVESRVIAGPQGKLATFSAGSGSGLAVVLLHADSGSSAQWRELQEQLAQERRVVALDFRGHGGSEPAANDDYGYPGRAADLAAVADTLDLGRFVLLAHSGGAAVALEFALAHPERVAGLLLIDPPSDPRALPRSVKDEMLKGLAGPDSLEVQKAFYASRAGSAGAVRERVLRDCELVGARARLGVARALVQWNPEPTLNTWRGPLRIIASASNDDGHALYHLRPDVEREIVADVGHWLQLEKPELVLRAARGFLAELERIRG